MGNHHDHNDHNSNEKKPVAFTVPLIFGAVIVFAIVLLVSIGDPKHGSCCCEEGSCSKECMDACKAGKSEMECCEKGEHGGHEGGHHGVEAKEDHAHEENVDTMAVTSPIPEAEVRDTTAKKTELKEEPHHH